MKFIRLFRRNVLPIIVITTSIFVIQVAESTAQTAVDSVAFLKHQVGFNATQTIRLFEDESTNNFTLHYRYKISSQTSLRSGINYRYDSSEGGEFATDVKAGFDKQFKKSEQWRFYTGVDFVGGVRTLSNSSRKNYRIGVVPFFGAIYYLDDHFSISTEPALLAQVRRFKNEDSFNPNSSRWWFEMELVNVGQIIIGIHF